RNPWRESVPESERSVVNAHHIWLWGAEHGIQASGPGSSRKGADARQPASPLSRRRPNKRTSEISTVRELFGNLTRELERTQQMRRQARSTQGRPVGRAYLSEIGAVRRK